MDTNNAIVVFRGRNIRRTWRNNEWWFSVFDIISILTESADSKQYVKKMRSRDPVLNANWGTICTPLETRAQKERKIGFLKKENSPTLNSRYVTSSD